MKFYIESGIIFDRDIWEIGAAGAQLPYKQTVTGSNPVSPTINYMPRFRVAFLFRAFSSAGEHFLHTEGVIGSIPVTPTIEIVAEVICLGFFYCTAIVDEDQDAVVTYYTFCSESQAAADDAANDEDAADDDANATVDDAEESNIASSRLVGQWMMPAMVGVGSIAGILAAAASPPSHI